MKGMEEIKKRIDELMKECTDGFHKNIVTANWDDPWDRSSVNGKSYSSDTIYSTKTKKRHEFSPVLLVITTAYNCKHCGAKKEDTKTDYCDEKEDDLYYDTGGW